MALADYVAAVLADSPKAYWKMDESSGLLQDSSGNGLHMTVTSGSPIYQQSGPMSSFSILYNGGDKSSRATISTVVNNFAIEMWIKAPIINANTQGAVYNGNSAADGWGVMVNTNLKFQGLAGGVAFLSESAGTLSTTDFKHVIVERNAGTWVYYLNGASDTANAGTNAPNSPDVNETRIHGGTNMQAVYAHVAIYETALGSAKAASHYAAAFSSSGSLDPALTRRRRSRGGSW